MFFQLWFMAQTLSPNKEKQIREYSVNQSALLELSQPPIFCSSFGKSQWYNVTYIRKTNTSHRSLVLINKNKEHVSFYRPWARFWQHEGHRSNVDSNRCRVDWLIQFHLAKSSSKRWRTCSVLPNGIIVVFSSNCRNLNIFARFTFKLWSISISRW